MAAIGLKIQSPSSAQTEAALAMSQKAWERVWTSFAASVEGGGGISRAKRVQKGPNGAVGQVRIKPS